MFFSLPGTLISLSILLPNLLMIFLPPKNTPEGLKDAGIIFTIIERIGQAGCFILPVILVDQFNGLSINIWFVLMALCVLAYWSLWLRYALKGRAFRLLFMPLAFIPIPMAVFPVLAFGFAAVWGQSIFLGAAAAILAVGHWANSWHTYQYSKK